MDTPPFSSLGLPKALLEAVEALGFERPSPIQAAAIPPALEGRDLVGLSETGSGKTAAFVLPALAKLDFERRQPQVLIVCPTRELTIQVCEEVHRLGIHLPELRTAVLYGGAPMDRQLRSLREGAQLIVGTPGRIHDHLRRRSFDPSQIRLAILDEADRMLDMGFRDDMEELLAALAPERQTLFFSATMNKGVEALIQRFGKTPETVAIERKALTVESVEQLSYEVRQRSKIEVLSRLLDMDPPRLALVFCNTKRTVDECTEALLARGYAADRLHGDITQTLRERTLRRFREGQVELLVATDVAARGIDINDIDVVFNYDLPQDPEDYVHRIGRTGRAGRSGRAISFVFGRDIYRLQSIERYTRQKIPRARIPSQEEVEGRLADHLFDSLRDRLEAGGFPDCSAQLDRLLDQGHTATDISAALFSLLRDKVGREGEVIVEDRPSAPREAPTRAQRPDGPRKQRFEEPAGGERDGKRLFLSLGKDDDVQPKDIVGMLCREGGVPYDAVGRVSMFSHHALVEVKGGHAEQALRSLSGGSKLRGKAFRLDYDRGARSDSGPRSDRGPRSERPSRPDRGARFDRGGSTQRERSTPFNRGSRPDRGARSERGSRPDRGGRPERSERFDRGARPERGPRFDRGTRRKA